MGKVMRGHKMVYGQHPEVPELLVAFKRTPEGGMVPNPEDGTDSKVHVGTPEHFQKIKTCGLDVKALKNPKQYVVQMFGQEAKWMHSYQYPGRPNFTIRRVLF